MGRLEFCLAIVACGHAFAPTARPGALRRAPEARAPRALPAGDAAEFATLVAEALERKDQIELSVKRGAGDAQIASLSGRAVDIKKKRVLQLNYKRRGACDVARNFGAAAARGAKAAGGAAADGLAPKGASARRAVALALAGACDEARATILAADATTTLRLGRAGLDATRAAAAARPAAAAPHDRAKRRAISPAAPFLEALNVTNAAGGARPGRERKLRQIFRFAELLDHAVRRADVGAAPRVVDMGCGKGYLTFAARELLAGRFGKVSVEGVEARRSLVDASNRAAASLGHGDSINFREGWIGPCGAFDVLLALHACDTATDDALHAAVVGGAAVVLAAPCCHKELRPQLDARVAKIRAGGGGPGDLALAAVAGHGALADRHAEAVTDALRCLALRLHGFDDARIIEWISLEHTAKNTMIVATRDRRAATDGARADDLRAELRALAAHHGVATQRLCALLGEDLGGGAPPARARAKGRMPALDP